MIEVEKKVREIVKEIGFHNDENKLVDPDIQVIKWTDYGYWVTIADKSSRGSTLSYLSHSKRFGTNRNFYWTQTNIKLMNALNDYFNEVEWDV